MNNPEQLPSDRTDPQCLGGSFAHPGCGAERFKAKIAKLERDLTRLRTACLALADEMGRTGREGDAYRLREIAK